MLIDKSFLAIGIKLKLATLKKETWSSIWGDTQNL